MKKRLFVDSEARQEAGNLSHILYSERTSIVLILVSRK
jgi:hypothetical protein